ncbi:short chain dehydrogenase [Ceratobasidium sp. AG-Ba]|nr:short chain dehydrogenase [Ceratobasidium sp. AG-Ba]QRW08195.1 short chain dehydrogenase [Ceratobasidium sp. AG-Ba]
MSSLKQDHPPVAVITGAAQGIGRAIAIKGYLLALGDLMINQNQLQLVVDECIEAQRSVMLNRSTSPRVLPVICDVSDERQVEALVQTAVTELDRIDVMVANAGIYRGIPLLDINVKGVLYSYRAAARAMIPRGGGRIVGACSAAGKSGFPLEGAYCASKFAVRGLTQTAAREWGQHGITVNTYAPGPTDTDMWNKVVMGVAPERAEASI